MYEQRKKQLLDRFGYFQKNLLIIFGGKEQLMRELRKYHTEEEVKGVLEGFTFKENGKTVYDAKFNTFFIWMPEKPKTAQEAGTLAHEIFHATCAMLENMGMALSDDSEEAYAYTIGFITEKLNEAMLTSS